MAKRRGGAWGNALGGYKLQARNKSGQFGSGTPVKRGSKAAFSSGGTPRYYAPGGKTYAKSSKAFVQPSATPTRTTKAQRRQAGYNATLQKREAQARSARRKKMVIGTAVVAAGIVGGAVAYKNRDAIKGSGIAHKIGSAIQDRNDIRKWKQNGGAAGPVATTRLAGNGRKFVRSERVMNSTAETGADDGFSPGKMAIKAIGGASVAGSVARSVTEVNNSIRAISAPRVINQEGVSEEGRHVPQVGYARRLALPAAPVANSRPSGQIEHDLPVKDRPIDRGVYGSTMDRRDFNETYRLNGVDQYGSGVGGDDLARNTMGMDRGDIEKMVAPYNVGRGPIVGRQVRSTGQRVNIEAADTSARKAVGNGSPRAWTSRESDQLDARINYDRRQELRGNKLFHNTTEDPLVRNSRGGTVDRISKEEENFRNDIRTFGIGTGQNPVKSGRLNAKQQADLAQAVGKGNARPLTGQTVPGSMDIPRTTPIAKNQSGEAAAQRFLDSYEDAIGRGIRPSREDRQKYKFLTGGADQYRPIPQDLVKKAAAKNNRNARDRARRAGVSE